MFRMAFTSDRLFQGVIAHKFSSHFFSVINVTKYLQEFGFVFLWFFSRSAKIPAEKILLKTVKITKQPIQNRKLNQLGLVPILSTVDHHLIFNPLFLGKSKKTLKRDPRLYYSIKYLIFSHARDSSWFLDLKLKSMSLEALFFLLRHKCIGNRKK